MPRDLYELCPLEHTLYANFYLVSDDSIKVIKQYAGLFSGKRESSRMVREESAIRLAFLLDGVSDTIAGMAGEIVEAYYKEIPQNLLDFAETKIPMQMKEVLKHNQE